MGVVFQDTVLLDTSIRENIGIGNLDATDEQIVQAAKLAEIHDFITTLSQGYDTHVNEAGGMSGGQRQRIALARVFLRDPPILLMDEPTSALDPATELSINQTIQRIFNNRTVICVTHRLAPVVNYDQIFVIEGGKLVEQGTHQQLLQRKGHYQYLWQKQSGFHFDHDQNVTVEVDRLRMIPIFQRLDIAVLEELVPYFHSRHVAEQETIFRKGDVEDGFYFIARGSVAVTISLDTSKEKRWVLSEGDYFGEIALFKNITRTATIQTLTHCILLSMSRWQFWYFLDKYPDIQNELEEMMEERLEENKRAMSNSASNEGFGSSDSRLEST